MRWLLPIFLIMATAALPVPGGADEASPAPSLPAHRIADSAAPPVTASNLLASERFWPYHVALAKAWNPPGQAAPLPAGTRGVLIRVEPASLARVDFGRDGLYAVPVADTDLIAQAERVRRGEILKTAPNFVLAIGPRLLDSGAPRIAPVNLAKTSQQPGFLAVFADPDADGFVPLARTLAPLRGRDGVETVLFPQGKLTDAQIAERLRSLDWSVPFVRARMSEGYTRTLVPEGTPLPAVSLQTNEGRLLFLSSWSPDAMSALSSALAESFSEPPR